MDFENKVCICGVITASKWLDDSKGKPVKAYRVAVAGRKGSGGSREVTCFAYPGRTSKADNLSLVVGDRISAEGKLCQHEGRLVTDFRLDLDSVRSGDGLSDFNKVAFSGIVGDVEHNSDSTMTVTLFLNNKSSYESYVVCTVPDGAADGLKEKFRPGSQVRVSGSLREDCYVDILGYRHIMEAVEVSGCEVIRARSGRKPAAVRQERDVSDGTFGW